MEEILVSCDGKNGTFEIVEGYSAGKTFFRDIQEGDPNRVIAIKRTNNGNCATTEKVPIKELTLV